MEQKEVINAFFTENYSILLQKCKDYVKIYNYHLLEPDEIVSELYLHILKTNKRTNKISELIMLSAVTLSQMFKYSNLAMYYISKILYVTISAHRTFDQQYYKTKKLKLIYCEDIQIEIAEEEYKETEINIKDINKIVERFGTGENWWKAELWKQKYFENKTYKQIGEYYRLNTTPVFNGVKDFNLLIKGELLKKTLKYEKV